MRQSTTARVLADRDYAQLLAVRTRLRVFERWSADRAAEFGLTGAQHQLLLAVRGHYDHRGPTIGDVADYLLLKHHSAVELAGRVQALGLIERVQDADDHRKARLLLTTKGQQILTALSAAHLEELRRLTPLLRNALTDLAER